MTQDEYDELLKDPTCRVVVNGIETLPTGQQKIKTPLWTIWVQKTASVNVMNDDPKKVQTDFVKVETVYKVDKQAALKKLKAGEKIVGLQLRYSESLRTK